jgi:hypothetical protein
MTSPYWDAADEPDGMEYHGQQYEAFMAEHADEMFQEAFEVWADNMAEDGVYPVTHDDYIEYLERQVEE